MSPYCVAGNIVAAAGVFGAGLLAGICFMSAVAALPAATRLAPLSQVRYRQALIRRLAPFMPPVMALPMAAPIIVLAVCSNAVAREVELLSGLFAAATFGITVAVNARLSGRIARWSTDPLPERWETDLRRWDAAHAWRTATAVAAFACAILARG